MNSIARFPTTMTTELARHDDAMTILGQMADSYARLNVFDEADRLIADNTRRAHLQDLDTFSSFLADAGMPQPPAGDDLRTTPSAWQGVTAGLVKAFREWMLQRGDAISSINRRLSTVRKYAKLAAEAGTIDTDTLAKLRLVSGYSGKASKRIDDNRETTRRSGKRTHDDMVALDEEQRHALKAQCDADTPQGRRDAVLICLLMDHGLRVGEVCGLTVDNVDLAAGKLTFYREKVNLTQTIKLSADALVAVRAWFDSGDAPALGPLLRGSRKGGALTAAGMSTTAASSRVSELANRAGLGHLSAHDLRHTWTTAMVRKFPAKRHIIQEAGGWSSDRMLQRYTKPLTVANESINISL
mgnify:CR=1 FL=1